MLYIVTVCGPAGAEMAGEAEVTGAEPAGAETGAAGEEPAGAEPVTGLTSSEEGAAGAEVVGAGAAWLVTVVPIAKTEDETTVLLAGQLVTSAAHEVTVY